MRCLRATITVKMPILLTPGGVLAEALGRIQQAAPVVALYDVLQVVAFRGVTGLRPSGGLPITWNVWEWR